ncbi:MAG: hypothetical protein A2132_05565 [Nitrospirae bacterium RBG_16_43_11]|nr:MAG: hypothetical protein A2132_05565 [Nitrospirae bacterium RBG_16_43_11]
MGQYILVLDQGFLNSSAFLVDSHAKIIARFEVPLKPRFLRSGWIEYNPDDILKSQLNAIKALFRKIGTKKKQIAALGISGQQSTIILWDKETGKPVYNAISYNDPRGMDICRQRTGRREIVRERTGLHLSPYYSASKIKWVLENVKAVQKLADKGRLLLGTVNTYILWHLSKRSVYVMDHASAAKTLLCNIFTKTWDRELLELFNLPHEIFPDIVPTSSYIGDAVIERQVIPIHASITEKQASLLGHGLFQEGDVSINYGDDGLMLANTGKKIFLLPGLLTTIAWSNHESTTYLLEGIINSAGSFLSWMKDNLGLIGPKEDIEKLCKGSLNRLFMLPSLDGLGSPHWDSDSTVCLYGLKKGSKREDIVRAAVEAIAFMVKDNVNVIQTDGRLQLKKIIGSGAVSDISFLMQFQADILKMPVRKVKENHYTALGTAFLAGLSTNIWQGFSSIGKLTSSSSARVFNPRLSEQEAAKLYERWRLTFYHSREWSRNFP